MKDLTPEEFEIAPARVQFLYLMAFREQPVGSEMIETAIKEHPEYFQDEIEHRRKRALVPQSVHDEYWDERSKIHKEVFNGAPESKGIIGWINDPDGYKEWKMEYDRRREIEEPLIKEAHSKYYSQYGIEWGGY